jgi:hypothetical protein
MGAMVASRARTTQYLKARVNTGRTIASALQSVIRNAVSTLVALWSGGPDGLTADDRASWEQYALNVSKRNRLGDTIHVAGVNWFVGNNTVRSQLGGGIVTSAPTTFNTGDIDWSGTTWAHGGTSGTLTLDATPLAQGLGAGDFIGVYVSPAFSPGRTKWYGQSRLARSIPGNASTATFTMGLPFGDAGTTNSQQISLRISRADGRVSSPFVLTVSP